MLQNNTTNHNSYDTKIYYTVGVIKSNWEIFFFLKSNMIVYEWKGSRELRNIYSQNFPYPISWEHFPVYYLWENTVYEH